MRLEICVVLDVYRLVRGGDNALVVFWIAVALVIALCGRIRGAVID